MLKTQKFVVNGAAKYGFRGLQARITFPTQAFANYSSAAPSANSQPYNTKPAIKEFATSEQVKPFQQELDTFIEYLTTPRSLKVLLYRPKNKQRIVELDLKDPVTGKLLEQRPPFTPISTKVLSKFLLNAQNKTDIEWVMYQLKRLKPKHRMFWYNYLNSEHFALLSYLSLFKTNQHSEVAYFFSKNLGPESSFVHEKLGSVYDIENYFNCAVSIKLLKKHLFHKSIPSKNAMNIKVQHYYDNVLNKAETDKTGLARVLVDQLTQGSHPILNELKSNINLPALPQSTQEIDSLVLSKFLNFVNEHQLTYISTRILELAGNKTPEVLQFNKDFKLALEKSQKPDFFDSLFAEYKGCIKSEKDKRQEAHLKLVAARKAQKNAVNSEAAGEVSSEATA
ncbi:hypothetical protein ACO0QE_003182 [Hanseniaspora vineae]